MVQVSITCCVTSQAFCALHWERANQIEGKGNKELKFKAGKVLLSHQMKNTDRS